jgi:hypothetical protein
MKVLHDTIDGSSVTISAPAGTRMSRPSSVGVFAVNGQWREFTTTDREGGRGVADELGISLTQSYKYQGGSLSLGTKSFRSRSGDYIQTDLMHLGVWEGTHSSIFAHLYNGSAQDLAAIFQAFTIVEGQRGARIAPKDRTRVALAKEPIFLQEFSGVGLLLVRPLTRSLARNLPRWSGTQTAGGELFVGRRPGSVHLVLVGQYSLTQIMPDSADCDSDVPNIAGLEVAWQPSSMIAAGM